MQRNDSSTASGSGSGDDEDRPEVHQKDDVRQRDEGDLLDERVRSVPTACSISSERS